MAQNKLSDISLECIMLLKESHIDFLIIEEKISKMSLLIKSEHKDKVKKLLTKNKYKKCLHPYGVESGYQFLYQTDKLLLFYKQEVFIDISFQLLCMSHTPKTWIPLEQSIQQSMWSEKKYNEKYNCWVLDDTNYYLSRIVECIFLKKDFESDDIDFFTVQIKILEEAALEEKFEVIFFRFSGRLIQLLKEKRYMEILERYRTFNEY